MQNEVDLQSSAFIQPKTTVVKFLGKSGSEWQGQGALKKVPFGDVRCLAMTGNELCTSFTGANLSSVYL